MISLEDMKSIQGYLGTNKFRALENIASSTLVEK